MASIIWHDEIGDGGKIIPRNEHINSMDGLHRITQRIEV